jgi:curved DNA-binding protein CbpA
MAAMPPRPMLPSDDLYARLELPVDASPEAIEVAWRALLKRHHPDVAGAHTDDVAKRINVAHDWLSDPELRARYDIERHPRVPPRPARDRRPARAATVRPRPVRRRPVDPTEAVERHIDRVRRLTDDELDRLSLAEVAPIAFVATISRFLPPDRLAVLATLEPRIQEALPARGRWDPATRDAVIGFGYELLLGPFLDEHLSEPFRERVRERLARGWEAAIDQPRYGPSTGIVAAALERLAAASPAERARLAVAATRGSVPVELPWPRGLSAQDDDALRVSSALAQRDAIALLEEAAPALARRSLGRAMHGLVLRHAFRPAELERLLGPWALILGPGAGAPRPSPRRGDWSPRRGS